MHAAVAMLLLLDRKEL